MPEVPAAETAAKAVWVSPEPASTEAHGLAALLEQPLWFAQILVSRGIETPADARRFLVPSMDALHDPYLLLGMQPAVDRVLRAVAARETILIYGDYDVDGTTATVLLKTAIDRITPLDANGRGSSLVRYHIPHRIREGYGMQGSILAEAAATGVRLVISVDTGIRAFAAAADCKRLNLDLIVTDHHLPDGNEVPAAVAVINPNQPGCEYPYKHLCGAAVAFKLAHALLQAATKPTGDPAACRPVEFLALWDKLLPSFLKLVAIATVADAVPLTGENRTIVALGLRALRDPRQHGLRALMDLAGVVPDEEHGPSATDIAFRIAPRINAAGRMDIASDVVRLFLARDAAEGAAIAGKLHQLNEERRDVEASVLALLEEQMSALDTGTPNCLVLDGQGWHRGVIGILASRVVERMGRPALVIAHEDGQAHGSGRSVPGFHLLEAITAAHSADEPHLFDRFGGHAHAVGFSLPSQQVPLLRQRMAHFASTRLPDTPAPLRLQIDAELSFAELTPDLLKKLRLLQPFGQANSEPLFMARQCVIAEDPRVLKEKHLKLRLKSSDQSVETAVSCLCWSRAVQWPERLKELNLTSGSIVDVVFRVRENRHPQFGGPEMELCDLRPSTVNDPAGTTV